jgi:hypothetical protein
MNAIGVALIAITMLQHIAAGLTVPVRVMIYYRDESNGAMRLNDDALSTLTSGLHIATDLGLIALVYERGGRLYEADRPETL